MKDKSQQQKILSYLLKGYRITPLEALSKFGCLRLGARIWNLKHMGHKIEREMVDDIENGKRYASYFIAGLSVNKKEKSMKGKGVVDFSRALHRPKKTKESDTSTNNTPVNPLF